MLSDVECELPLPTVKGSPADTNSLFLSRTAQPCLVSLHEFFVVPPLLLVVVAAHIRILRLKFRLQAADFPFSPIFPSSVTHVEQTGRVDLLDRQSNHPLSLSLSFSFFLFLSPCLPTHSHSCLISSVDKYSMVVGVCASRTPLCHTLTSLMADSPVDLRYAARFCTSRCSCRHVSLITVNTRWFSCSYCSMDVRPRSSMPTAARRIELRTRGERGRRKKESKTEREREGEVGGEKAKRKCRV